MTVERQVVAVFALHRSTKSNKIHHAAARVKNDETEKENEGEHDGRQREKKEHKSEDGEDSQGEKAGERTDLITIGRER